MPRIKLAVIGCGRFANSVHYPTLTTFGDVEIAGVCDLDTVRLHATAERWGIAGRYTDFRKMLDEIRPSGVYVIMPEAGRAAIVREVLLQGYPVFIEKPAARTAAEIEELAALAKERRLITMVGCNRRFIPVLVEARRRILERGPVRSVSAVFLKNELGYEFPANAAPDMLVGDGVHALDTMRWLAGGQVVRVQAVCRKLSANFINDCQALVEFDDGCVGVLQMSWTSGNRYHAFEMHGQGISAYILPDSGARIVADGREEDLWTMASEARYASSTTRPGYGYLQENRHFIDCIKSGRDTDVPFSEAVKSMSLIDAIKLAGALK
jgi:virulence factor